ncbi:MAG: putative membrane protein YfcA, partial [Gammaproteobacteria bacterium]
MTLALLLAGIAALLAGFTSAFAGFGTGLVAAGFWFQVLPVDQVPLLICVASVLAQVVSRFGQFKILPWQKMKLFLGTALMGILPGIWALQVWSPDSIRIVVGFILISFALSQLSGVLPKLANLRSRLTDGMAGIISGSLGGFAGLSGVIMALWLQVGQES